MHSLTWRSKTAWVYSKQCKIHVLVCQIKVNLKRTWVIFFPTTKFNFDKLNQLDIVLWLFLNEVLCSVFVGKFTKISYIFIHVLYVRGIFFFASHLSRKFLLLFKVYWTKLQCIFIYLQYIYVLVNWFFLVICRFYKCLKHN